VRHDHPGERLEIVKLEVCLEQVLPGAAYLSDDAPVRLAGNAP